MKKIQMLLVLLMLATVMAACGKDESNDKVNINIVDKPANESDQGDYDEEEYYQDDTDSDSEEDWDYDNGNDEYDEYDEENPDDENVDDEYFDDGALIRLELGDGHVYEYFEEDIPWTEAREACINMGGHLLTITDQEEADIIYEYFYDTKAWIGAYKFGDCWYWVTHEDWGFTNWDNNEPSNSKGAEWCVHLWTDMRWNDLADEDVKNVVQGYICEFDEYVDHGDY